jgi:hypothetical protein
MTEVRNICLNNMTVTSWTAHRHFNKTDCIGFNALIAAIVKSSIFCDITPCHLASANHRPHLQLFAPFMLVSYLAWFSNLKRRWYVPQKRRLALAGFHNIIAQKTEIINRHCLVSMSFLCLNSGRRRFFFSRKLHGGNYLFMSITAFSIARTKSVELIKHYAMNTYEAVEL